MENAKKSILVYESNTESSRYSISCIAESEKHTSIFDVSHEHDILINKIPLFEAI